MDTVRITDIQLTVDGRVLHIHGTGHATEFMSVCRQIARATIRGNYRWWFQSVDGKLPKHAGLVSDMFWHVLIEFSD